MERSTTDDKAEPRCRPWETDIASCIGWTQVNFSSWGSSPFHFCGSVMDAACLVVETEDAVEPVFIAVVQESSRSVVRRHSSLFTRESMQVRPLSLRWGRLTRVPCVLEGPCAPSVPQRQAVCPCSQPWARTGHRLLLVSSIPMISSPGESPRNGGTQCAPPLPGS